MPPNAPIMSVTKGVEEGTFCLMSDILFETLGPKRRTAYLSGPSFAKEVMAGEATAVVIASDCNLAGELSQIISSTQFRCHTTGDVKVTIQMKRKNYR
jgi:glycerol-3-phosphate dehydrogenase